MPITPEDIAAKQAEFTGPGGFFELDEMTVAGRSYPVYKHAPKTAIDILQNGRAHGDQDFIVFEDRRYSYDTFFAEVDALAAALQQHYGIQAGDRVAIAMRNNPEWAIAFSAVTLIGAIVVPVNSWGRAEELHYSITDCGARLLIADQTRFTLIADQLEQLGVAAIVVPEKPDFSVPDGVTAFADATGRGRGQPFDIADIAPEDGALILYTSGSTGFPKGVLQRHISVGQSLMNMLFLGMLVTDLEGGPREYRGGADRETPMLTVPLFHATGLLGGLIMPLMLGQKVVMMYKWDSHKALELIQNEHVTGLNSVPAILQDLLGHPEFDKYNTDSLIRVGAAGAATPAGLPELIEAKVGTPSRSAGYGMTETMAVCSIMSGAIFDLKPDSAGIVAPIMQVRFTAPDGTVLPAGQPGEIEMYGICVTPGYWEKPEANAQTFTSDGWLKSGDIGLLDDDGFLHITGRIKEIVIRGGENIYPGEIEQAAYELETVREVVVFGEPDAAMGEELVMVVYPAPDADLDDAQLRRFLKQRLAGYKVPRTIELWDHPLPRNASEKLHKLKVKEAYLDSRRS